MTAGKGLERVLIRCSETRGQLNGGKLYNHIKILSLILYYSKKEDCLNSWLIKVCLILLNSKCIAIYLIHKEAVVKQLISTLYFPASL